MDKKRVIYVIDSCKLYGKERANILVASIFSKNEVDVLALLNSRAESSIINELSWCNKKYVTFPRDILGKFRFFKGITAFFSSLFKLRKIISIYKPDFIFVPTEIALAYLFPVLYFAKCKIVFRCGDSPLIYRRKGILKSIYSILWKQLIIRRVDNVVCNAKFIRDQLIASGRKWSDKDYVIYNYPPVREVKSDNVQYPLKSGKCMVVGFLGRIVSDKGVKELVTAILNLRTSGKEVSVYIGGDTNYDVEYMKTIKSVISNYKNEMQDAIYFVGNVNDLDKFYENVDLMAIPSIYAEPMANVLIESKFHKKPVIIFNIGGMPEIVRNKVDGYICENISVQSLYDAIDFYYEDRSLIAQHGQNAFESIEELGFTESSFTNKWLNVIQLANKIIHSSL